MSSSTTPGYPRVEGHGVSLVDVLAVTGPDGTPIPLDPDVADTWFVGAVPAQEADPDDELVLRFGGLATVAEVTLDGEPILSSDSMFATHEVALGSGSRPAGELRIRCRALAPILAVPRRPRARWRSRIVEDNQLRWIRTTIEGRAPGFAPGPPTVGPWRPIWLERRRRLVVEHLRVRARLDDTTGIVEVDARLRPLGDRAISARPARRRRPDRRGVGGPGRVDLDE